MLEEVRQALPGSLAQAQELIGGREQMVEQARQEAERIIESAHAQRGTLISDTAVARQSQDEADRILSEARREAEEIRAEADDYVDSKLANFEVVLTKTIGSVDRGREKLLGRGPGLDDQGRTDEDAPEYSADPQHARSTGPTSTSTPSSAPSRRCSPRPSKRSAGAATSCTAGPHPTTSPTTWPPRTRRPTRTSTPATPTTWPAWRGARRSPSRPRRPRRPHRAAHPGPAAAPAYDPYGYQQPQQDPYGYQQPAGPAASQQDQYGSTDTSSRTRTPTTRASSSYAPRRRAAGVRRSPQPPAAAGRARRDQPLRHQHDRSGPAAGLRAGPRAAPPLGSRVRTPPGRGAKRAGLGLWRPVQYPGCSVARTSAIQAARFAQRSRWQPLHDLESRKSPEHAPRPPQSPRVRHTRAGTASRCAPAALPHRGGPPGPRDPRGHPRAAGQARGHRAPSRVGHGRGACHRHRPCVGRGVSA